MGLSQLTRVMVAVGEKMGAVIRMEKQRIFGGSLAVTNC
jgi:hypothetical protein